VQCALDQSIGSSTCRRLNETGITTWHRDIRRLTISATSLVSALVHHPDFKIEEALQHSIPLFLVEIPHLALVDVARPSIQMVPIPEARRRQV